MTRTDKQDHAATALLANLAIATAGHRAGPAESDGLRAHSLDTLGLIAASAETTTVGRLTAGWSVSSTPTRSQDRAFLFGAAGDALALDDFDEETRLHPGAPVVAAALAAVDDKTTSGTFEGAIAAGYAVALSLGAAMDSHRLHAHGVHPSSAIGALAAAAAVSVVRDYDAAKTADAIGIAASLSSGIFELDPANTIRNLQIGNAAAVGVRAADFAIAGFSPNATCLEGSKGWFGRHGAAPQAATDRLAQETAQAAFQRILRVSFKPYAHFTDINPATALMITMMSDHGLSAGDIASAEFALKAFTGAKLTAHYPPASKKEAMRSLPWVIACILDQDKASLTNPMMTQLAFDPARAARLSESAARISWQPCLSDDGDVACTLTVTLNDGQVLSSETKGYPGDGRMTELRWGADAVRTRMTHFGPAVIETMRTYDDVMAGKTEITKLRNVVLAAFTPSS